MPYKTKYFNSIEESHAYRRECLEACVVGKAKDRCGNTLDKHFLRKVADGIKSLSSQAPGNLSSIVLSVFPFVPSIDMCLKGKTPCCIRKNTFYEHPIDLAKPYLVQEYSTDGDFNSISPGALVAVLVIVIREDMTISRHDEGYTHYTTNIECL